MSILSKLFGKSQRDNHVNFTRYIIGDEIRRGSDTYSTDSISDEVLLGLPESTVITIIHSYFDYKKQNTNLSDPEIYKKVMIERGISKNKIDDTLKYDYSLLTFIMKILSLYDQRGFLDPIQIIRYIDKYKNITNV
jgi:hypothetical protein